jgi:RNA polymerase sigma factor (sigma-70 family)
MMSRFEFERESKGMTAAAVRMHGDVSVTDMVMRARNDDRQAWDVLVERYAPLVWSICRRYRLSGADAADVGQNVWLRLVEQLDRLRDPAALPGWLVTTTQRECWQFVRTAGRRHAVEQVPDADDIPGPTGVVEQELLAVELGAALREALSQLPPGYQQLISLLTRDPPVSYAEISTRLGIPVGSIGPTRRRCLNRLRRHPAVAALINPEADSQAYRTPGRLAAVGCQV